MPVRIGGAWAQAPEGAAYEFYRALLPREDETALRAAQATPTRQARINAYAVGKANVILSHKRLG